MMKQFRIIYILPILFLLIACEQNNMDPLGEWTLTNPEISEPANNEAIVLDENFTAQRLGFSWTAASSSARYQIRYSVEVDSIDAKSSNSPIISFSSDKGGTATTASISYVELDEALAMAGFKAGSTSALKYKVVANCVGTIGADSATINITQFSTKRIPGSLYISGEGTETGDNLESSIQMKKMLDTAHIFEVYTQLNAGSSFKFYSNTSLPAFVYGQQNDELTIQGNSFTVEETGVYRVMVNLDEMTYEFEKIDRLGMIGSPLSGQWNSDEPLTYDGLGIWKGELKFENTGSFAFRLNESWDLILKQIEGTSDQIMLESFADANNIALEDMVAERTGTYIVSIDLSGDGYSYNIEKTGSGGEPVPTPETLYLLDGDGNTICEFVKDGDIFSSEIYLALQTEVTYTLNSAADGSGSSYTIDANIGVAEDPAGDFVSAKPILTENSGDILVERDQAYSISIDFSIGEFSWHYYNMKIFHWDDANAGWDDRIEVVMEYSHPYTFTATASLSANFDTKFNSPWAVEFGAKQGTDDRNALSGTATNKALQDDAELFPNENFLFITTSGNYLATLTIASDYKTATYNVVAE